MFSGTPHNLSARPELPATLELGREEPGGRALRWPARQARRQPPWRGSRPTSEGHLNMPPGSSPNEEGGQRRAQFCYVPLQKSDSSACSSAAMRLAGGALRGLARQARGQQRRQRGRAPGRRRQVDRRQQLAPRDRLLAQARVRRLRALPLSEAMRACSYAGEVNKVLKPSEALNGDMRWADARSTVASSLLASLPRPAHGVRAAPNIPIRFQGVRWCP